MNFGNLTPKSRAPKPESAYKKTPESPEKKAEENKKSNSFGAVISRASRSFSAKGPRTEKTRSRLVFSRDAPKELLKVAEIESEGVEFTIDHSSSLTVERNEPLNAQCNAIVPIESHAETLDQAVVVDRGELSGETNASSRAEVSSGTSSDPISQNSSASYGSSKGRGKLVRESKQVYGVDQSTPSNKVAEMVSVILQNKLGTEMGTVRVLKMMYCATGGKIKIGRLQPETGSCAQKLSNLLDHERLEHVQALYVKLELYLSPIQREVIAGYIGNINSFRKIEDAAKNCSILLLNDYIRAELVKLGVDMETEHPIG